MGRNKIGVFCLVHEQYYQAFLEKNRYPRELQDENPSQSELINFSSNDYLGLTKHPVLIARSQEYAERFGVGVASSRLVTGNLQAYQELEEALTKELGKPEVLILASGYQANMSVLEALLDAKILGGQPMVFADRYAHVSMLIATQHLSRLQRFQHNDLDHLESLLKRTPAKQPKFILVESLYSMDGDRADLSRLAALSRKYQALLYVDDAHAVGVYGKRGFGLATEYATEIDVIMGTFSKGLGSFGAYIACSKVLKKYLINKCRGLIYSTGLSPAVLGAIAGAIDILPNMQKERTLLQKHAKRLKNFFVENNLESGNADTHIIPWILHNAESTLCVSQALKEQGILAATIRPPSVPINQSRIRFCLSAKHSETDIIKLENAIRGILIK